MESTPCSYSTISRQLLIIVIIIIIIFEWNGEEGANGVRVEMADATRENIDKENTREQGKASNKGVLGGGEKEKEWERNW